MNTIFVAIASYLDYEIKYTILDCIHKAKHPENLYFSVCLQYDENEGTDQHCLLELEEKYNIKIDSYHYTESEGGCWARYIAQSNYNSEKFSLQVDSHTRFIQNWDEIVINDYNKLKETVEKPLISFLPPSYSRIDKAGIDYDHRHIHDLDKINVPKIEYITDDYWPVYNGYNNEQNTGFTPKSVIILYGGFIFTEGQWIIDIEQDPEHYYTGEEFALTIRSFTYGYDIYTPSQVVAWHRAHPQVNKKHFNNNIEEVVHRKHAHAIDRLIKLIKGEDLGKYGPGDKRTIAQYAEFAGIDFETKTVIK
jgi:hypothetical protein